jgi:hypothetical protein
LSGLGALAVVLVSALPDARTALVWVLAFGAIVGVSIFMVLQPGTFLYASSQRIGLRTSLGVRYEVPAEAVSVLRVASLPFWGAFAQGVSVESREGRRLLTHANARYDEEDLQELANRIGAHLVTE